MNNLQDVMNEYDVKQIEDIAAEYGKLFDWFDGKYPEGNIRLDIDNDRIEGVLKYKLSVYTPKVNGNTGLITDTISIDSKSWTNLFFMDKFKSGIFNTYKEQIDNHLKRHWEENQR